MSTKPFVSVGERTPTYDAALKVTGSLQYTDDLKFPGMLHAKVLFSPYAHAKVLQINTEAALALPGVKAVAWYKNTPNVLYNSCGETIDLHKTEMVFSPVVRFVGDRVAAIAAETEEIAAKAIHLLEVEYEILPHITTIAQALDQNKTKIHSDGNIFEQFTVSAGDPQKGLAEADQIFEATYFTQAVHHAAMEPHSAIAVPTADGKLTIYSGTQDVFGIRNNLCHIFNLPMNRVRVINPGLGGGFGGKVDLILEGVVAQLSLQTGRPVKLTYSRKESIIATRTRHAEEIHLKTGITRSGKLTAQIAEVTANAGAYASGTTSVLWTQNTKFYRQHKTANMQYTGRAVYTNTPIAGAMRGYGSPQLVFAQQSQFNTMARTLGIDMLDLELANLVEPNAADPRDGQPFGNARPIDCLHLGAEKFGWKAACQEMHTYNQTATDYLLGVGMAAGIHGNGIFGVIPDTCGVILKMNEDGSLNLLTGVSEMGNGIVTLQRIIISEVLAIPQDRISIVQADTEVTLWDLGDYSSRGTYVCGQAALKAAESLAKRLKEEASKILKAPLIDLEISNQSVVSASDANKSVSFPEIIHHAKWSSGNDFCVSETFASNSAAMSYAAHFVKLLIEKTTGKVKILDYVAAHDLGRVLNPLQVEGQIEGAIQMGMGYALCEDLFIDQTGKVNNDTFKKYSLIRAGQMPPIRIALLDSNEPNGPFGGKSIGECSVVPVAAAIANAISNALSTEFYSLPITPNQIKNAIFSGNKK